MTNYRLLCIIISVGGVEVLPLEVLPHKLPHTQRHTPHTQPRRCFYILHIETMETTTPQTNEALFAEFIKEVEKLNKLRGESRLKTCRLVKFSYAFGTQYETNAPLFESYICYNGGHVERRTWEAWEFDEFYIYCKALHDLARAFSF